MFPLSQGLFSSAGEMEIEGVVIEEVLVEFLNVFFRRDLTLTAQCLKSPSIKKRLQVKIRRVPGEGRIDGESSCHVPKMAVTSRMVGPMGPRGRTMMLVAEHQKHRAARRSSLSRTTSIDERMMAS
ncbi:hypothetical protein ACFX1Q_046455 [Malus domestica]